MTEMFGKYIIEIKNNIEKSIRIWPRWNSKFFEEFKKIAPIINKEIEIKS
jgi:hypothetical protein